MMTVLDAMDLTGADVSLARISFTAQLWGQATNGGETPF
jgi:hypothetical protein